MKTPGRVGVIIPPCVLAVGVCWLCLALTEYGVWDSERGPMGGFFPAIVSGILTFFALPASFSAFREQPVEYNPRIVIPFAG